MKLIDEIFSWSGLHGRADSAITHVQIFEDLNRHGRKVCIMTEPPDNPGCSVTNGVEILAKELSRRFGLDPMLTTWIEHYPKTETRGSIGAESFDLVSFTSNNFNGASWRRIHWEAVRNAIATDRPNSWAEV